MSRGNGEKRSARDLHEALEKNRKQIQKDLSELGHRFHNILNPRQLLSRHPILTAGAGAVLGFLIVRRPTEVVRAASRLASLGAPLLLSALIKGDGSGSSEPPGTPEENR